MSEPTKEQVDAVLAELGIAFPLRNELTIAKALVEARAALTLATQRAEAAEAERDALRKACESFVEWLGREDAGCGVTAEERDTPEGEHKWRVWYDGNLELCARSLREAKAALAVQPTTEGL